MKFIKAEPVNQIESNLFIRHKVEELKDGCFVEKCICCGEIIEDYTPNPNRISLGTFDSNGNRVTRSTEIKGHGAGYVYVNKSGNSKMVISEYAIKIGFLKAPTEFIDCTIINS